jgi:hypothetical protein
MRDSDAVPERTWDGLPVATDAPHGSAARHRTGRS